MGSKVLVIGGAGFIGSHTCIALIQSGFEPIIIDDFSNSSPSYLKRINHLAGREVQCQQLDFKDSPLLEAFLDEHQEIAGIIHFAAFKYVGESTELPLKYYQNNVSGFVGLVDIASRRDIPLVFSSSAAVYGEPLVSEVTEDTATNPQSPYGWSKLMDEIILRDACAASTPARGIALRYFNVVGAHPSGEIGETPTKFSQNLWPFVVKAATGEIPQLTIYGNNYPTNDGTCERDYVHVIDLAEAHVAALKHLQKQEASYYDVFNVGTGKPTSVLGFIGAASKAIGKDIPYRIGAPRPGDPTAYYAVTSKIEKTLGWKASRNIDDAITDGWRWHHNLSSSTSS